MKEIIGIGHVIKGTSRSRLPLNLTWNCFCHFSYRLADHPRLSTEFSKHLRRLPQSSGSPRNRALYRRLIDTYGTHYIHQVRNAAILLFLKRLISHLNYVHVHMEKANGIF